MMECEGTFSRIIFWEPLVSPHKAGLVRGLVRVLPGHEIISVAAEPIDEDRRSLGWSVDFGDGYDPIVCPSDELIARLVAEKPDTTLHVFSGIRWVPMLVKAICGVQSAGARFAIMSEPRAVEGLRGVARVIHSWVTERWFRRNCQFVLAIGRNGPSWFRLAGYPAQRVFPFAYFIPEVCQGSAGVSRAEMGPALRIGFVGRLVKNKGVFDLVRACARLRIPYEVVFVGRGADEGPLRNTCQALGVIARFMGAVSIEDIPRVMEGFDVLVLPSHVKDGWGVVISEALMAGCAVIATPKVGASLVIRSSWLGRLVRARRASCITAAILSLQATNSFSSEARARRAAYAAHTLAGCAGASYLKQIIRWCEGRAERPVPFYDAGRSV